MFAKIFGQWSFKRQQFFFNYLKTENFSITSRESDKGNTFVALTDTEYILVEFIIEGIYKQIWNENSSSKCQSEIEAALKRTFCTYQDSQ